MALVDKWLGQDEEWSEQLEEAKRSFMGLGVGEKEDQEDTISLAASDWDENFQFKKISFGCTP